MNRNLHIGTSGWMYEHWRGIVYPEEIPKKLWFEKYSDTFHTVEINSTFYRLPKEKTFLNWYEKAKPGFIFAVKMWRVITHLKRLSEPQKYLPVFLERAKLLKEKLGPILIQLPPGLKLDLKRLDEFLSFLPYDIKFAIEFRNTTWFVSEVKDLLKRKHIGFCIFHHPELRCPEWVTSGFVYLRYHGYNSLYRGNYPDSYLKNEADFISKLLDKGLEVYAYFNNDFHGFAFKNAITLMEFVKNLTDCS